MTTFLTPRYYKIKTLLGYANDPFDEEVNETVREIINEGNVIHEISQTSSFNTSQGILQMSVMIVYFRP